MADRVSSLIVKLVDQVTGPAKAIANSLKGITQAAKGSGTVGFSNRLDAALERNQRRLAETRTRLVETTAAFYAFSRAVAAPIDAAMKYNSALTELKIKAGLTEQKTKEMGDAAKVASAKYAQSTLDILKGSDIMVGFGASADVAQAAMGPIAKTASATGASIEDLSTALTGASMNLGVASDDLGLVLDMMDRAGKAGGFELKDMAGYANSIFARAGAAGQEGVKAVANSVAALQIIRRSTGSPGEAATAYQNLFQKATAQDAVKKWKKVGINIRKEMDAGFKKGKTIEDVLYEQFQKAKKKNKGLLLSDLYQDKEVQTALIPLFRDYEEFVRMREDIEKNSAGEVDRDLAARMLTYEAKLRKFQSSWERFQINFGTALLPGLTAGLDVINPKLEQLSKWAEENPDLAATLTALGGGFLALSLGLAALKWIAAFSWEGILVGTKALTGLGKGIRWVTGAGSLASVATGLGLLAAGAYLLEKNKEGFRLFLEAQTGAKIKPQDSYSDAIDYGDMSGQAFRQWAERNSEFMREYYRVTDEWNENAAAFMRGVEERTAKNISTNMANAGVAVKAGSYQLSNAMGNLFENSYDPVSGKQKLGSLTKLWDWWTTTKWPELKLDIFSNAESIYKLLQQISDLLNTPVWDFFKEPQQQGELPQLKTVPGKPTAPNRAEVVKAAQAPATTPPRVAAAVDPSTPGVSRSSVEGLPKLRVTSEGADRVKEVIQWLSDKWHATWNALTLPVQSDANNVYGQLQSLHRLWTADWGTKTLQINAPKNVFRGSYTQGPPGTPQPVAGARASGGPVMGGKSYLVGERGKELFTPGQSGRIIPNHALGQAGSQQPAAFAPTFHINVAGNADRSTVEQIRQVLRDEVQHAFRGIFADTSFRLA